MIVDFDDFYPGNDRLDLLHALHDLNPAFRCTLFAVPALGTDPFWDSVPTWCELAVHGWDHGGPGCPNPWECSTWPRERMAEVIALRPYRFVAGFKAPGWQISDGCYQALHDARWWVADQPYNDPRRPDGLRVHRLGDGDHWHGHVQDVCGNGIEESWGELCERVASADSFQLISEVVVPWNPQPDDLIGLPLPTAAA